MSTPTSVASIYLASINMATAVLRGSTIQNISDIIDKKAKSVFDAVKETFSLKEENLSSVSNSSMIEDRPKARTKQIILALALATTAATAFAQQWIENPYLTQQLRQQQYDQQMGHRVQPITPVVTNNYYVNNQPMPVQPVYSNGYGYQTGYSGTSMNTTMLGGAAGLVIGAASIDRGRPGHKGDSSLEQAGKVILGTAAGLAIGAAFDNTPKQQAPVFVPPQGQYGNAYGQNAESMRIQEMISKSYCLSQSSQYHGGNVSRDLEYNAKICDGIASRFAAIKRASLSHEMVRNFEDNEMEVPTKMKEPLLKAALEFDRYVRDNIVAVANWKLHASSLSDKKATLEMVNQVNILLDLGVQVVNGITNPYAPRNRTFISDHDLNNAHKTMLQSGYKVPHRIDQYISENGLEGRRAAAEASLLSQTSGPR